VILLDTPVISALMDPEPDPRLLNWFAANPAATLFISTVTEAELLAAAARLPDGLRQRTIAQLDAMVTEDFAGRVLTLDSAAARDLAAILARAARLGQAIPLAAAQNAAFARANGARVATLAPALFAVTGVETVNPLDQDPR
jgi:predicted nucleic acid-binding protein